MKIVIVGCGSFGSDITELLLEDGHEIVVVDSNEENIENMNNTLDVLAIHGNGADYNVLNDIGMKDTDVCIACTASDEVNLLVSVLSRKMGAKHTIARFRSQIPGSKGFQFVKEQIDIDLVVSPEYQTALDAFKIINGNDCKSAILIGATRIATFLTRLLVAKGVSVQIIDNNEERCNDISEKIPSAAVVINDDETKHSTLLDAGIKTSDAFVSVTAMDEENILTSLYAKDCGVPTVVTKLSKSAYSDIVNNLKLEYVVSPRTSTALMIVDFVRGLSK